MSPMRRDAQGKPEIGPTWESITERHIREAMEAGAFDNLPGAGKPLRIEDDDSDWALAHHVLKNAGYAPDWIETDKEIRAQLEARDRLLERARRQGRPPRAEERDELASLVEKHNRLCLHLEQVAPTPRQHRRRLNLADELAALEAAAESGRRRPPAR